MEKNTGRRTKTDLFENTNNRLHKLRLLLACCSSVILVWSLSLAFRSFAVDTFFGWRGFRHTVASATSSCVPAVRTMGGRRGDDHRASLPPRGYCECSDGTTNATPTSLVSTSTETHNETNVTARDSPTRTGDARFSCFAVVCKRAL